MEYKVTGTDDEYIANHNHSSECHIFIFVNYGGDNICSSRTSVIVEHNAQTYATHGGTDDTGHEILSGTEQ